MLAIDIDFQPATELDPRRHLGPGYGHRRCKRYGNDVPTAVRLGDVMLGVMLEKVSAGAVAQPLIVRCECGSILGADCDEGLVQKVRLHISEFHPDVGGNIPADLILAMAEERE